VLVGAFLLFGIAVYSYLRYAGHRAIERGLTAKVSWIAHQVSGSLPAQAALDKLGSLPPDLQVRLEADLAREARHYTVLIRSHDGKVFYAAGDHSALGVARAPAVPGKTELAWIERTPQQTFRVASWSGDSLEIHVAVQDDDVRNVLAHTRHILMLLAPGVLLIGIGGGWVLSDIALRPIGRIIDIANRFTVDNVKERIPERDVDDELGRLIQTLNRTADRLESSIERMKQFSWNVAHELQTPLTILRGEAELSLGRAQTAEESQELAATFLEETVRLSGIVDDLMTLAQADAGRVSLEFKPVRLEEMVEDLRDDATILAGGKDLRVELLQNDSVTVLGDGARLRRLFRSLLSNAVRYTDAGGTLRLRSWRDGGVVRLSIQDTGIGIPPESLGQIFDRFYRADPARSRDSGGSGLGLSLARWIAEAHGGTIAVESQIGRGSTFTVSLPLATGERGGLETSSPG
jgi:heavy metal sensor kinase